MLNDNYTDSSGPSPGDQARDDAVQRVGDHADPAWMTQAKAIGRQRAQEMSEFTTDEMWPFLSRPREPRAMGAVMTALAKEGLITASLRTRKSNRRECHSRPIRIWRSLVYED